MLFSSQPCFTFCLVCLLDAGMGGLIQNLGSTLEAVTVPATIDFAANDIWR